MKEWIVERVKAGGFWSQPVYAHLNEYCKSLYHKQEFEVISLWYAENKPQVVRKMAKLDLTFDCLAEQTLYVVGHLYVKALEIEHSVKFYETVKQIANEKGVTSP